MRTALLLAAIAVAVLWVGGEQHRSNCISANRTSCSVLPWDAGQQPDALRGLSPRERRAIQRELDAAARR